jgi:hypothetical protein
MPNEENNWVSLKVTTEDSAASRKYIQGVSFYLFFNFRHCTASERQKIKSRFLQKFKFHKIHMNL